MNSIKKYFAPITTGVIVLSLSSCAYVPTNSKGNSAGLAAAETINSSSKTQLDATASTAAQPPKETPASMPPLNVSGRRAIEVAQTTRTVPVNIYRPDSQCQTLVSEKVAVPAATPVNAAVGKVLKEADSGDFAVAGYRVNVSANSRLATIDLRLSPDSQRQFVSLSTCEQFALFGSLRKTLTDNSQLKIKDVRFTQQGQEIKL
jgi:hypothetical protein